MLEINGTPTVHFYNQFLGKTKMLVSVKLNMYLGTTVVTTVLNTQ